MATIPPDEVVTTIILVLPGFIALAITLQIVGISKKVEFSAYVVWSFFVSGLIDLVLIVMLRLPIPPTTDQFLLAVATSWGAAAYPVLVLLAGLAGAFLLRADLPKYLRKAVWYKAKGRVIPGLVWDDSLKGHFEQWIIVETKSDQRILGCMLRYSTGDEPAEIYLSRP